MSKEASVKAQFARDKNLKEEDVRLIREWLTGQHHLPAITELDIILFLHSCYYDIEAAKTALDKFYTMKTSKREIFGDRDPQGPALKEHMKTALIAFLPKQTEKNHSLLYFSQLDSDPDKYNLTLQLKHFDMTCMMHLHEEGALDGIEFIIDLSNAVIGHLFKMRIQPLRIMINYLQEAMPIRLKTIHFINIVPWMDKIMAILKLLINNDLFQKMKIHSTLEELYECIGKEYLPEDIGGYCTSLTALHEESCRKLNENLEFFRHEDTQLVDESKRYENDSDGPETFTRFFGRASRRFFRR